MIAAALAAAGRGATHRLRALGAQDRGAALIEFAYALPLLLFAILYMFELSNYALVRHRISQLALQVADNASRIGSQQVLRNKPITEGDINDLLIGAQLQSGGLDIRGKGRIILSSLEVNATPQHGQWIHWQRCFGTLDHSSTNGREGDGRTDSSFLGMGPSTNLITAEEGDPVMFVEIGYRYTPLVSATMAPSTKIIEIAAMTVRDDRDTTQVYRIDEEPVASCS